MKIWPDRWEQDGAGYSLGGQGFFQVIATADDAVDVAYLYDTAGGVELLSMTDNAAVMSGTGFNNQALSFGRVVAEATEGDGDHAIFNDGVSRSTIRYDADKLTAFGENYSNNALGFDVLDSIYSELDTQDRVEFSGDLDYALIEEVVNEVTRYRLSMAPGNDGVPDDLEDRITNLPIS